MKTIHSEWKSNDENNALDQFTLVHNQQLRVITTQEDLKEKCYPLLFFEMRGKIMELGKFLHTTLEQT